MEAKTFDQWRAAGRQVIKGEHARAFLAKPDLSQAVPLFEADQTTEAVDPVDASWIEIPADEWQRIRKQRKGPAPAKVIRAQVGGEPAKLAVWVGANKTLIKALQESGFRFNPGTRRWDSTPRSDVDDWITRLNKAQDEGKYNVIWD